MIPLRLQLKNFLSYGSKIQTIDFSGYKLICLSGKNGHGKSALLDGITWSLWGQARKIGTTSKPDQGILRLGEVEMMACFDFMFNGQTYRVKRDFSKKYGKPHTHVEFGLLDPEDERFISLTEKTTNKTQEKIEKTLGLDYETFTNSSFLRQGHANEFSKKTAKERKEVLSSILGLHHYDEARKFIQEITRNKMAEKLHIEKIQERTAQELELLKDLEVEQETVATELKNIQKNEQKYAQEKTALEIDKKKLEECKQQASVLLFGIEQHKQQETKQREQLATLVTLWKKTHKNILSLPEKSLLEEKKAALTQKISGFQKALQQRLTIQEEALTKKEALSNLRTTLERETTSTLEKTKIGLERLLVEKENSEKMLASLDKKITVLVSEVQTLELEIAKTRATISPEALVSDLADLQKRFEKHKALYQKWIEQGNWISNELKSLDHKQLLSQDQENPSCPLCEQNLSQARKRFLHKKFATQGDFLQHRFARLKHSIEIIKARLVQEHGDLKQLQAVELHTKKIQEITEAHTAARQEKEQLTEALAATTVSLAAGKKELITLQEHSATVLLKDGAYCALQKTLVDFEKLLQDTQYDSKLHAQSTQELASVEELLKHSQQLHEYKIVQEERRQTVHALCVNLKALRKTQEADAQKMLVFAGLPEQELQLRNQERLLINNLQTLIETKELLLQKAGNLEAQSKKKKELEAEREAQQKEYIQLTTELHEHQVISTALGKDGIQALLIEDAIPEIEQEANDLLAQLTDNQASISIESLRDLQKGGTKETLDINISDVHGIRPYELFSGGEAFRIDFALRIAISKLLARRAGTSLQTLIIDEGFGSQDEDGLNRMMDAIYSIQNNFEKIIIVSHLSAMKEQFPVHFNIQKGPQGSVVTIIEQG